MKYQFNAWFLKCVENWFIKNPKKSIGRGWGVSLKDKTKVIKAHSFEEYKRIHIKDVIKNL